MRKRKSRCDVNFAFFFFFSISHSYVIHMDIFCQRFSATTLPSIMKFGKNIGYDKFYSVIKNQPHIAYQSQTLSICPFFFLSNRNSCHRSLSPYLRVRVLKVCIHLKGCQVYCVNENQDLYVYFAVFFQISFFPSPTAM